MIDINDYNFADDIGSGNDSIDSNTPIINLVKAAYKSKDKTRIIQQTNQLSTSKETVTADVSTEVSSPVKSIRKENLWWNKMPLIKNSFELQLILNEINERQQNAFNFSKNDKLFDFNKHMNENMNEENVKLNVTSNKRKRKQLITDSDDENGSNNEIIFDL